MRKREGRWVTSGLLTAVTVLLAASAEATHAVDHRYVVLGYVRDAQGRPLARSPILVLRERTGLSYRAETDADGFYVVAVHLHDENVLDWLRVTVGSATIRIDSRFNPLDGESPRGTRVDFRGGQAYERREVFVDTIRQVLGSESQ